MATGRYADAVSAVREAVALAGSGDGGEGVRLEALAQLMVFVLDSMRTLPYDQALALAKRMDTDIPGLLFSIAPFAERAIRTRRRLAGEFDAVLKEDIEARDRAHRAGLMGVEFDALRSMAATYAGLNSHDNEVRVLEEARDLARAWVSSIVGEGKRRDVPRATLVNTLAALGEAQLAASRPRPADESFAAAIAAAATADDARGQDAVARELGRAWLGRARVAIAEGRLQDAEDILERALSGAIAGTRFDRGEVLLLRAEAEPADADHAARQRFCTTAPRSSPEPTATERKKPEFISSPCASS